MSGVTDSILPTHDASRCAWRACAREFASEKELLVLSWYFQDDGSFSYSLGPQTALHCDPNFPSQALPTFHRVKLSGRPNTGSLKGKNYQAAVGLNFGVVGATGFAAHL